MNWLWAACSFVGDLVLPVSLMCTQRCGAENSPLWTGLYLAADSPAPPENPCHVTSPQSAGVPEARAALLRCMLVGFQV